MFEEKCSNSTTNAGRYFIRQAERKYFKSRRWNISKLGCFASRQAGAYSVEIGYFFKRRTKDKIWTEMKTIQRRFRFFLFVSKFSKKKLVVRKKGFGKGAATVNKTTLSKMTISITIKRYTQHIGRVLFTLYHLCWVPQISF